MSVAYSFPKSGKIINSANHSKLKGYTHIDFRKLRSNGKDFKDLSEKSQIFLKTIIKNQKKDNTYDYFRKLSNLVKSYSDQEKNNKELIKSMQLQPYLDSPRTKKYYRKDYINSIIPETPGPAYYHITKSSSLFTRSPSFPKSARFDSLKEVTPGPSEYQKMIYSMKKSPLDFQFTRTYMKTSLENPSPGLSNYNIKDSLTKSPSNMYNNEDSVQAR